MYWLGASMVLTAPQMYAAPPFSLIVRRIEALAAWAVISRPVWKCTPWRSWNVQVLPSDEDVQLVASSGCDLVRGRVVVRERLVHLAHRDDAVGVLGRRIPAVDHHRRVGVVGERGLVASLRWLLAGAGRSAAACSEEQRDCRAGRSRPSAMPLHGEPPCAICAIGSPAVERAGLAGLVQAAERARGLGPDPDRRRGEVGQRDFLDLDDLDRAGVGARGDRVLPGLAAGLVERGLPAAGAHVEDPVDLAADRRDRGADGVGRVEVVGPDDLADAGQVVGNEDAAAADRDQGPVTLGAS